MIHVKWNRDVLHFPVPLDAPLGQLRNELAEYTQLKPGSFKLVYKGAVMKEDRTALGSYGVKEGATIWLIGGDGGDSEKQSARAPESKAKSGSKSATPQTEEATIQAIWAELNSVREKVVPDVEAFVGALRAVSEIESETIPATPPTQMDHTRLSELLLQSLLRLDAMYVPGVDWPEARVQRKAAVREVQGVLDQLDGAWATR